METGLNGPGADCAETMKSVAGVTDRIPSRAGTKLAVTLRFEFMVTVVGLVEPDALPLHDPNVNVVFGQAVRVTSVPSAYLPTPPGSGLATIEPPFGGL